MTIRRREISIIPLKIIRDAKAELADDGRPIAAAVVVAGEFEVGGGGAAGAGVIDAVVVGPFEVAVVVVGGEEVVGEVLVGVAGAPFRVLRVFATDVSQVLRMESETRTITIIWMCKRLLGLMLRAASAARMRAHAVG